VTLRCQRGSLLPLQRTMENAISQLQNRGVFGLGSGQEVPVYRSAHLDLGTNPPSSQQIAVDDRKRSTYGRS
jgi:hypothetical protein